MLCNYVYLELILNVFAGIYIRNMGKKGKSELQVGNTTMFAMTRSITIRIELYIIVDILLPIDGANYGRNGPPQQQCEGTFDIMCVLDESGSIPYHSRHAWARMKEFCGEVITSFEDFSSDIRFAAVEFSDDAEVTIDFRNADDAREELAVLHHDGGSYMHTVYCSHYHLFGKI